MYHYQSHDSYSASLAKAFTAETLQDLFAMAILIVAYLAAVHFAAL